MMSNFRRGHRRIFQPRNILHQDSFYQYQHNISGGKIPQDPKAQTVGLTGENCKMRVQKNKHRKKTWDEEMMELFPQNISEHGLTVSQMKPSSDMVVPLKLKEPHFFRIWDISQKFLFVVNNMLIANPQNSNLPAQWMAVLPNNALDPKQLPIFMGLHDGSHTLSCTMSIEGQPQLQLVERDIMELYKKNEKFLSFSFYSKTDGSSETCSFESAEFPGWFISTSPEPNKPISLGQKGGPDITLFYFKRNDKEEIAILSFI